MNSALDKLLDKIAFDYPGVPIDAAEKELFALRARLVADEQALADAQKAFAILGAATIEDGWVQVAPQFICANLEALNAALLASRATAEQEGG